ncbi:MAG TPA: hypothetical protein VE080_00365 [Candidatus Aquicultoraceae bacterium]|nr:hypothetical protein [Candidatus Aquicultoraceae bacterium]
MPEGTPVPVEIPRQEEHGDFSTNVALTLAGPLKRKPREVSVTVYCTGCPSRSVRYPSIRIAV